MLWDAGLGGAAHARARRRAVLVGASRSPTPSPPLPLIPPPSTPPNQPTQGPLAVRRRTPPVIRAAYSPSAGGSGGGSSGGGALTAAAASKVRSIAIANFGLQLPLTVVSASILIFALMFTNPQAQDISRVFTFAGIIFAFASTWAARRMLDAARRASAGEGAPLEPARLLAKLVGNTNLNLLGLGATLLGLQASVGTLVSKTMLSAANAPYAQPQPGATLVSLDVFSLQASTNTLLAHFLSIVCANLMIKAVAKAQAA